ncbi:MAG: methyl-accepting chemotaxis protein [Azonexus sp.]|jgi:methyl-accepting chemotaxis protein|nr:methyl-accepting chemotaxis protein [Azonexus sp.]
MFTLVTVKAKLTLGFATLIILTAAVGALGMFSTNKLSWLLADAFETKTNPIIDYGVMRANVIRIHAALWECTANGSPEHAAAVTEPILQEAWAETEAAWRHYFPALVSTPLERQYAEKLREDMNLYRQASDELLALLKAREADLPKRPEKPQPAKLKPAENKSLSRHNDSIRGALLAEKLAGLNALFNESDADFTNAIDENIRQERESVDISSQLSHRIKWSSISVIAIAVILGVFVALSLFRLIMRSLHQAIEVADNVANGKLGQTIHIASHDEFARLLGALREMDGKLSETVRGILATGEQVANAAAQIAAGNLDLSSRTEAQAAALEETASTMTQIADAVQQNADGASKANQLTQNAMTLVNSNSQAISIMVRTMADIKTHSGKISDIVGLIEEITFQTNILALNAAVEAARAGEQGRGFAVVASEIRALSQRSSKAAKEIKSLIAASAEKVQEGARQVTHIGDTTEEFVEAIRQVSNRVEQISMTSDEQSQSIVQVHQAIAEIDRVTQQNAALVEEAAAATESMEELAANMKNDLGFFKITAA